MSGSSFRANLRGPLASTRGTVLPRPPTTCAISRPRQGADAAHDAARRSVSPAPPNRDQARLRFYYRAVAAAQTCQPAGPPACGRPFLEHRRELAPTPAPRQTSQSATAVPPHRTTPCRPHQQPAARPHSNANVTTLAPTKSRRADRRPAERTPDADSRRTATSNATTVTSTAGATSGATHTGTPSRRASASTFPNPNVNVSPTTIPTMTLTADTTGSRRAPGPVTPTTSRRCARPGADQTTRPGICEPEASPRPPPHDNSSRHTTTSPKPRDHTRRSGPTSLDTTRHVRQRTLNQRVRGSSP